MSASFTRFLEAAEGAPQVLAHARLLLTLSRRFAAMAPAGLGSAARVVNYKAGKIVIHADNGAVATKLRMMSQRLCDEFAKRGLDCKAVEIKVHPGQNLDRTIQGHVKPLSAATCGRIADTAAAMPEGELKRALEQLLDRAAKS